MTKRKIEYWVIPPDADGEFVANMEEVLETYEKTYDPDCPVVCMDEQPVQLIGETRVPIPATKEHPERVDYEYERKGTASIFMFAEPLSGYRQATARPRRTKHDWAHEVAHLLDTRYADVESLKGTSKVLLCLLPALAKIPSVKTPIQENRHAATSSGRVCRSERSAGVSCGATLCETGVSVWRRCRHRKIVRADNGHIKPARIDH